MHRAWSGCRHSASSTYSEVSTQGVVCTATNDPSTNTSPQLKCPMKYHNTSSLGILELIQFSPFQPDADQLSLNELLPLAGYRKRTLTRGHLHEAGVWLRSHQSFIPFNCSFIPFNCSFHTIHVVLAIPVLCSRWTQDNWEWSGWGLGVAWSGMGMV